MNYKEATHAKLIQKYENFGKESALKIAHNFLHTQLYANDLDFKRDLHGEVCETVLEIIIRDEIKHNPKAKDWLFCKGTVLKDRDNMKGKFATEIDFILFTPECVFLFECKSYAGNKSLIKQGTLYSDSGKSFNVYKQSKLHRDILERWIEEFTIGDKLPMLQMCMFQLSNGALSDERSRAAKIEMPCLSEETLVDYLANNTGEVVWDMEGLKHVKDVFDRNSPKLRSYHLNYVKSLNKNRRY